MNSPNNPIIILMAAGLSLSLLACSQDQKSRTAGADSVAQERKYKLERVGPAQVVQLYADGFDQLSQREKIFTYYLYLASIAARDISIDQHHPRALEVRDLIEAVYTHDSGINAAVRDKIAQYTKLFWINNGFYDNLTSRKFVLDCTFDEFRKAVRAAQAVGAAIPEKDQALDRRLNGLRPVMFDPVVDSVLTDKTPGHDWIKGSAVNFYARGLTYTEVERWARAGNEKHPLNSTVVKQNGKLIEGIWRSGNDSVTSGLYTGYLNAAIQYLEQAIPYAASDHQAETIRQLIRYYQTGNPDDFNRFNVLWVKDSSSIDFIHGFIEVYLDPRGQKAEFEASVYYMDPTQTKMMRGLASYAQYFENHAPWKDEYKKKIDRSPIANSVDVVIGTGGAGPNMPIGINLPNEQWIREQYGTKSVLLHNVVVAYNKSTGKEMVKELAWDEREVQNDEKYGSIADDLHTALHEVIGHGSGKTSPKLGGTDPSVFLPGYYNTLEEARADLVALWNAWDPKLVDVGIAKDQAEAHAIGETMYQAAVRVALSQLWRIGKSTQLEEDHLKNRQLIVNYALRNSNAIKVEQRNGKTYYHIEDYDSLRAVFGKLLADIMRIKAEGDLAAARALVDTYGLKVDVRLRDEIQNRVRHLDLPAYSAFVMPKLEPVSRPEPRPASGGTGDPTAKITDVKVSYPLNLATQMLEYSAFTKGMKDQK